MNLNLYGVVVAICVNAFATCAAVAAELPDAIIPVASGIERCIAEGDNESSKQFVHYEKLRSNWEVRWWLLLGRKEVPTEEFIRENPELWNAGTVVKLSLKGYCEDIAGVRRLLHGGLPTSDLKDRKEFASVQAVQSSPEKISVTTSGDDEKPVLSVFELIESRWMLTDVVLQLQ